MSSSKYIQVIEDINRELRVSELSGNIGVCAGTSGIDYDRIISQKMGIRQRVYDVIEHNIIHINSGYQQNTICNVISGFGLLCEHLRQALLALINNELSQLKDDETSWNECFMLLF